MKGVKRRGGGLVARLRASGATLRTISGDVFRGGRCIGCIGLDMLSSIGQA